MKSNSPMVRLGTESKCFSNSEVTLKWPTLSLVVYWKQLPPSENATLH
jgi:hypothetical protein